MAIKNPYIGVDYFAIQFFLLLVCSLIINIIVFRYISHE